MPNIEITKTDSGMVVSAAIVEEQVPSTEIAVTEFVKDDTGAVTIASVTEIEAKTTASPATTPEKTASGAVTANPTPDDSDMTEVMWDDVKTTVVLQEAAIDAIHGLVGSKCVDEEQILEDLVKSASVGSFTFLSPGVGSTADYVPDRAQIFLDKDSVVHNVIIG